MIVKGWHLFPRWLRMLDKRMRHHRAWDVTLGRVVMRLERWHYLRWSAWLRTPAGALWMMEELGPSRPGADTWFCCPRCGKEHLSGDRGCGRCGLLIVLVASI